MKKLTSIQLTIIVMVLLVLLPLVFLATQGTSVQSSGVTYQDGSFLSFNLFSSQKVTGSCILDMLKDTEVKVLHFFVIDPNGEATEVTPTYHGNNDRWADFSFVANKTGSYELRVSLFHEMGHYVNYEYSITPPTVLGLSPILFIGIVIAIGAVLELVVLIKKRSSNRQG